MKQVIIGGYYGELNATATGYNTVAGGYDWAVSALTRKQVVSSPGTLSNLLVELSEAPGSDASYTITLMKNDVAQDLAVTIADEATTGSDARSVAVVAGDIIHLRSTYSGSPTTPSARWSVLFDGTNAKESLILGACMSHPAATRYSPIMHGMSNATMLIENQVYQIIPTPGKIKNLYVALSHDPGTAPDAYRFTLRKNGASQTLTVTITANDKTGNDTAHEITVAAGDYVNLMIEPLNTPSAGPYVRFGFTFEADIDGESLLLGQSEDNPQTLGTEYNHLISTFFSENWYYSESRFYQGGQPMTLKKLYVMLSGAPGTGKNYLIGVRVNGSTKLSVTIASSATTGSDLVNTWDVTDFDELNIISTPSGTPAAVMVYWGLVCCTAVAPTVTTQDATGIGFD